MMLAMISPVDMMIVVGVALVVFGPKRLPDVARQLGSFVREARSAMSHVTDSFEGFGHDVRSVGSGRVGDDNDVMRPRAPGSAAPFTPYDQRDAYAPPSLETKPPVAQDSGSAGDKAPNLRLTDVSGSHASGVEPPAAPVVSAAELPRSNDLLHANDVAQHAHEANTL